MTHTFLYNKSARAVWGSFSGSRLQPFVPSAKRNSFQGTERACGDFLCECCVISHTDWMTLLFPNPLFFFALAYLQVRITVAWGMTVNKYALAPPTPISAIARMVMCWTRTRNPVPCKEVRTCKSAIPQLTSGQANRDVVASVYNRVRELLSKFFSSLILMGWISLLSLDRY